MDRLPILIRIIILAVWMFGIPVAVGNCFLGTAKKEFGRGMADQIFMWISGQMLLWAGFQIICVPMVVYGQKFSTVSKLFLGYTALLFLVGVVFFLRQKESGGSRESLRIDAFFCRTDAMTKIFWIVFAALFLLQLVLAVGMTCADGDDAYYVAVSTITNDADSMYQKLPYTGGTTEIDVRHGLAPFPVWIAFLARVSGIRTVVVAHVAVQLMLIPMTYGIFLLLGKKLFPEKQEMQPLFLIFTEILVIFGGNSIYTAEHFMLARSRQGKTALCSIIVPFLFLLVLLLYENLQESKSCGTGYWLLLLAVATAGCLCSTMGAVLVSLFVGIAGLCGAVCYKKWRILAPLVICLVPCGIFALLYAVLQ